MARLRDPRTSPRLSCDQLIQCEAGAREQKEAKLVLDWRKKQRTRADVYTTVKTVLDKLPRAYSPELYQQKCDTAYQHVYDSYQGEGRSVYSGR